MAMAAAMEDIEKGLGGEIPNHLKSPLFKGYKYPHDYENHYVAQEDLPADLRGTTYYHPGPNKTEQAAVEYWNKIKR
jgi:putative ATPase